MTDNKLYTPFSCLPQSANAAVQRIFSAASPVSQLRASTPQGVVDLVADTEEAIAGLQAEARNEDWPETMDAFLKRVRGIIGTERNGYYGRPRDNHSTTAEYWHLAILRRYGVAIPFDALDVCQFNRLQKESRLGQTPDHTDSLDDIAGYAGNALDCLPPR
jgi:hypothetical protein